MTYFKPAALQKFILKLLMEVFRNEDENSVLFIFTVMLRPKSSRDVQALHRFKKNLIFLQKIQRINGHQIFNRHFGSKLSKQIDFG